MLLFYEGLPRAGKSYSCIKDYLIPQLQKKRHVYAYIHGLNFECIAEAAGLMLSDVQEYLHVLTEEDVKNIDKEETVATGAFVIIDELQNFWPKNRASLSPSMTKFVAEHGHRTLDILCMGQVLTDCHVTWCNRMAQKIVFEKREVVGKPNEFKATIFKPILKGDRLKWEQLRTLKPEQYDEKYFGCYASHTEDATDKETFIDERATVWAHPILKKWLPIFGVIFVLSIYQIFSFFSGNNGLPKDDPKNPPPAAQTPAHFQSAPAPVALPPGFTQTGAPPVASPIPTPAPPVSLDRPSGASEYKSLVGAAPSLPDDPQDAIDDLSKRLRIRFGGYARMGDQVKGFLDWHDSSFEAVEHLSFDQVKNFGWTVFISADGDYAEIRKGKRSYIATTWPIPHRGTPMPTAIDNNIRPVASIASAN